MSKPPHMLVCATVQAARTVEERRLTSRCTTFLFPYLHWSAMYGLR